MKPDQSYPPAPAHNPRRESGTTSIRVSRLTLELLEDEARRLPVLGTHRYYRRSLDELLYQLGMAVRDARLKTP